MGGGTSKQMSLDEIYEEIRRAESELASLEREMQYGGENGCDVNSSSYPY